MNPIVLSAGQQAAAARLIPFLYDAADNAKGWAAFLHAFLDDPAVKAAGLTQRDAAGAAQVWAGIPPALEASYRTHLHATDPWLCALRHARTPAGTVVPGHRLVTAAELNKSTVFTQVLRPAGLAQPVLVVLEASEPRSVVLAVFLKEGIREAERDGVVQLLGALVPHMQRVRTLQQRAAGASVWEQAATDTLERVAVATVALGTGRRAMRWNRLADHMLRSGQPFRLTADGRLTAGSAQSDAALSQALEAGTAWWAVRPDERGPRWVCSLAPLGTGSAPGADDARGVLHVLDPEARLASPEAILVRMYGLTPAEVRLCGLVAQGTGPTEAASRLGISSQTTRTQLKHVMQKVGVRKQSQLAHLVTRLTSLPAAQV